MKQIDSSTATIDNTFTEGDPTTPEAATQVTADWLNVLQAELIKIVKMAGITPDQTSADKNQIAKALAVHVAGLDFYSDTGTANTYTLAVTGSGEAANTQPPAYFDGMRVRFFPGNNNTGASTAKVGTLTAKDIKIGAGAGTNPTAGVISAGNMIQLVFDAANDCFKIVNPKIDNDVVSLVQNGYKKEANGFIIQWGYVASIAVDTRQAVTFPITFPNAIFVAVANYVSTGTFEDHGESYGVNSLTVSGMNIENNYITPTQVEKSYPATWIAIGW